MIPPLVQIQTQGGQTTEQSRLREGNEEQWREWGPYLSDRAWGTVREDYSQDGNCWDWFPYSHAISRAYRWSEDGIAGISNSKQNLCFSLAFWNGLDDHIKERFFGLTNEQGNHGEDVKELYYYVDNVPSHAYMKMTYIYPQVSFPYDDLIKTNAELRGRVPAESEYELCDSIRTAFDHNQVFKIDIEYAKVEYNDIICRVIAKNMADSEKELHVIPQMWFRNTWSWYESDGDQQTQTVPQIQRDDRLLIEQEANGTIKTCQHPVLGRMYLYAQDKDGRGIDNALFTENETNMMKLFGKENCSPYTKDTVNDAIVNDDPGMCNPAKIGSKVSLVFRGAIPAGAAKTFYIRLAPRYMSSPFVAVEQHFSSRKDEADEFYNSLLSIESQPSHDDSDQPGDEILIQRSAIAGLLWSKQFFHFHVGLWRNTDPRSSNLNPHRVFRHSKRNSHWKHMCCEDIISMPDKWEYPWFAAWDLAFQVIVFAMVDPQFAKKQLLLFLDERYLHPNGQIPAYEWNFEDVNPPVHAWAVWRVFKMSESTCSVDENVDFLEQAYHKLLLNFTWWINRKDLEDHNVFEGGFLGMDNIAVFDRSHQLPTGGKLEQADGTAWMSVYCLNMLVISLQLTATKRKVYENLAIKFLDHFFLIANTMSNMINEGKGLWDDEDGFFYDILCLSGGDRIPLKIRSFVGLIPLFATEVLENEWLEVAPKFCARLQYFINNRANHIKNIASLTDRGKENRLLISAISWERFQSIMCKVLDPEEFLSDYGLRTLSKYHATKPYIFNVHNVDYKVSYEPAESETVMFGGNSNWRGPIWFPVNYLLLECLQKYHSYYGAEFQLECPVGSGIMMNLHEVVRFLCTRLAAIFKLKSDGSRAFRLKSASKFMSQPGISNLLLFHEYFHGDTGQGLGASHQTGWTALVAKIIDMKNKEGRYRATSLFATLPVANSSAEP